MSACATMTITQQERRAEIPAGIDSKLQEFNSLILSAKRAESRLSVTSTTKGKVVTVRFMLRNGTKTKLAYIMSFEGTYAWYNAISYIPNAVNIAISKKTMELMREHDIAPEEVYSFREKHRGKEKNKKAFMPNRLKGYERNKIYQREYRKLYRAQNGNVTEEQRTELRKRLNFPTK